MNETKRSGLVPFPENRSLAPKQSEIRQNEDIRERLCSVVRSAGTKILEYRGHIGDIGQHYGHESSSLDPYARSLVNNLLDETFPDIDGIRRFELMPVNIEALSQDNMIKRRAKLVYIIDEIDGTTNAKRELANLKAGEAPRPASATCIAACKKENIGSVVASAIFAMDTGEVYSSFKAHDTFLSFRGDNLMKEKRYKEIEGDSVYRVMVVGYSNTSRLEKAKWEEALCEAGFRVYDGSRASTIDLVNIIRGRFDAYIDGRAIWGANTGATLQSYDITAAIPIVLGAGFSASGTRGEDWQKYGLNSSIPLVVSRAENLHDRILEILAKLH